MTDEESAASMLTFVMLETLNKVMLKTVYTSVKAQFPDVNDKIIFMQVQRCLATQNISLRDIEREMK